MELFLTTLFNDIKPLVPHESELMDLIEVMTLLVTQEMSLEDAYYTPVGSGSFKVAYEVAPEVVFKFSPETTELEQKLYDIAKASHYKDLFLDTLFYDLDRHQEILSSFDCGDNIRAIYVQAKCSPCEDDNRQIYGHRGSKTLTLQSGTEIGEERLASIEGVPKDWIEAISDLYGEEYLVGFLDFLFDNDIVDIRTANVGYAADGRPIIFDWWTE